MKVKLKPPEDFTVDLNCAYIHKDGEDYFCSVYEDGCCRMFFARDDEGKHLQRCEYVEINYMDFARKLLDNVQNNPDEWEYAE